MSLVDSLKGLVGKGREAASKNSDKINDAVDKAGNFIDEKTQGKYTDKIEKGKDAARKAVPPNEQGGGQPGTPEPGPRP
ncbi:antitoxin [Nocardia callitridis]|uniref:Antitoxin n=1 Tax=Nocardia callitridis TaxID=648753 RepID=A0ABP9KXI7_9NOCA